MHYLFLAVAIIAEVAATSALAKTAGFTKPLPTLLCLGFYALAFSCLAQVVKFMPIGIAYAIWCGAGIVLIAGIAWRVYDQRLDIPAIIGISFILVGTVIINAFSSSVSH
ncbi:DMT family transporter [Photobacterium sp. DNB23_23_1]|uniref:Multidrug efflux SMR transporter n=1 Tax=Photobacterium pectinilyticum TaxID=2906793 RepID=A0ABT1MYV6_9GAMM|nr:multidrug efflux SMR transporter [Photobacterium sp. ZSDE20]MCQ1057676.1 multidrug efflux SMR transporter [Photobacterium sp. ZSDE20]MDD1822113.1 multidrug efflux SMR transporter [Photobacterium sp. ZSDE20]